MDYTKFRLKSKDELTALLENRDHVFVISCNKCFKEFTCPEEPEGEEFARLVRELGKDVTGCVSVDFLCNSVMTGKKLEGLIPEGTETVAVVACGLGIQTVEEFTDCPVLAAADSVSFRGYHGMALTDKRCGACAQCYLNLTGGICPVVDCAKGLVNGPCGGAKDGKCEVDAARDCAWVKITRRLEAQGRLEEMQHQPVQLRDYSKVNHKAITEYVKAIREKRLDGFYGGVHPEEGKELCSALPLQTFPEPEILVIPLQQHAGAPAEPVVQPGDSVKMGQLIGKIAGKVSCSVHSSVSGTVLAVEPRRHPTLGSGVLSVVIRSDGLDTPDPAIHGYGALEELTPEQIVDIVRDAGISGMGGAGFPAFAKMDPNKPVETLLVNGSECEPLLSADHRMMLERPDDVVLGVRALMKTIGTQRAFLAIEDNKPDAIELLTEKFADWDNIQVVSMHTQYPQGANKTIVKRVLGKSVPSGGRLSSVGAVMFNVSTVAAIGNAIRTGMPLIERAVSVTGEKIARPANFMVKIGTSVKDLVAACGGLTDEDVTVKTGGPMMGAVQTDLDIPVIKTTNGVIAVPAEHFQTVECLRCGRCADVCPQELAPLYFAKYTDEGNLQGLVDRNIKDCIECRCCEFVCSAKIPLVKKIKAGKKAVKEMKKPC